MSNNIGVFVDTSDIYHKVKRKFSGKLCYDTYYDMVVRWGTIQQAFAYGMQIENEAGGFIACLKAAGFNVLFKPPKIMVINDREIKRCEWNVRIAIDIVKTINRLDIIVLGSSNPDLIPLIHWIKDQGVKVYILASCVPKCLRDIVDKVIEITEEYLEEEKIEEIEDEDEIEEEEEEEDFEIEDFDE